MTYEIHWNVLLETVGEHGLEFIVHFPIVPICIVSVGSLVALYLLMYGGGPDVEDGVLLVVNISVRTHKGTNPDTTCRRRFPSQSGGRETMRAKLLTRFSE